MEKRNVDISLKRIILYPTTIGFLTGITIASLSSFSLYISYTFLCIGISLLLFFLLLFSRRSLALIISIFIIFTALGMWRFDAHDMKYQRVPFPLEEKITIEGVVAREPDMRDNETRLTILVQDDNYPEVKERILIKVPPYSTYVYGDKIQLEGKLRQPSNVESEDGSTFNYVMYLRKQGIGYEMPYPKVSLVSEGHGAYMLSFLLAIKQTFINRMAAALPDTDAALIAGMLVGSTQSLGEKLLQTFRHVGLSHIIVLSGFNISLIADVFRRLGLLYSRNLSYISAIVSVILFVGMAGAGASVLRAAAMSLLLIIASIYGREYQIGRALLAAGAVMVCINPYALLYDISFQLSFLATCGLVYVSPIIESRLPAMRLRALIATTLGAQLSVLPLIINMSGDISLISLLVNILVVPMVPFSMLLGFITMVAAFIHISLPFAFLTYISTQYVIKIAEWCALIPFGVIHVEKPGVLIVVVMYILMSGYVVWWWKKHKALIQKAH